MLKRRISEDHQSAGLLCSVLSSLAKLTPVAVVKLLHDTPGSSAVYRPTGQGSCTSRQETEIGQGAYWRTKVLSYWRSCITA